MIYFFEIFDRRIFLQDKAHHRMQSAGVVTYVKLHSRSNAVLEENSRSAVIYVMHYYGAHFSVML